MGTVYEAEDTSIGKRYVVKTLHSDLGDRRDLTRRMQNEARALARLRHPNIVDVITAGVTGDALHLPFYVMERLSGESLRAVLKRHGPIELRLALGITIDLLQALEHAHEHGVIHRDVKPDNVFLHRVSDGLTVTKLLDFGIVSLIDATRSESAGHFVGTLRYAAPEQLRGDAPSPKMDLYAVGLILFEMVAGRGPLDHVGDSQQIAAARLTQDAPLLSTLIAVPTELDELLVRALDRQPEGRPRDAFAFASELRNLRRVCDEQRPTSATTAVALLAPAHPSEGELVPTIVDPPGGPDATTASAVPVENVTVPSSPMARTRAARGADASLDTRHTVEGRGAMSPVGWLAAGAILSTVATMVVLIVVPRPERTNMPIVPSAAAPTTSVLRGPEPLTAPRATEDAGADLLVPSAAKRSLVAPVGKTLPGPRSAPSVSSVAPPAPSVVPSASAAAGDRPGPGF
jgi:serine/threonine-protein kinase